MVKKQALNHKKPQASTTNVIWVDFRQQVTEKNTNINTIFDKKKKPTLKALPTAEKQNTKKIPNIINLSPKINEGRRKKRRIVISGLMHAAIVVPGKGLINQIELYDISESGVSFDLPYSRSLNGKRLAMRVYLNSEDFFHFNIMITENIRYIQEEGVYRYGAKLLPNHRNKKAIKNLVDFIESVSGILHKDHGEILLYKQ